MSRLCGACCGLIVFAAVTMAGLAGDVPVDSILRRSLIGLAGGFLLGAVAGRVGMSIVQDHLPHEDDESAPPTSDAPGRPAPARDA